MSKTTRLVSPIACVIVMAGCGGGGGGSSTPAPPAPPPPPQTYTVGGTVSGLDAAGLVLQNNAGNDLAIAANGAFAFPTTLASGAAYAVTIKTQPNAGPVQSCSVTSGSGTVAASAVANVAVACVTKTAKFLYVPTTNTNSVYAFKIDGATGTLEPVPGSPFPTTEPGPRGAAGDPAGKFLYVTHHGSAVAPPRISAYAINAASGALDELNDSPYDLSDPPPPNGQVAIIGPIIHPSGAFGIVYIPFLIPNTTPVAGRIFGATIDQTTGELAAIPGLTPLTLGFNMGFPGGDLTGRVLYLPHNEQNGGPGRLAAYQVSTPSGTFTPLGPVLPTGGNYPNAAVVDGTNSLLFVPNAGSQSISVFSLDSAGVPTAVGTPVSTGPGSTPAFAVLNRRKNFLYVTDQGQDLIHGFTFNAAGQLTPMPGSPWPSGGDLPTLGTPARTGSVFFVTHSAFPNNIQGFTVNDVTGALTPSAAGPAPAEGAPSPAINDPSGKYLYSVGQSGLLRAYTIDRTTAAITVIDTENTGTGANGTALVGLQ